MNAIQGYLEKLGGNFMIAAFVPCLAFVTACMFAFEPLLPTNFLANVRNSLSPLNQNGLIILLIATMMGFTLTSLNTYIYKLFEGYVLPEYLKPLQRIELARARQIRRKRDLLNKKIQRIEKWKQNWVRAKMPAYQQAKLKRINDRIGQWINLRDGLAADYDQRYPPKDSQIMPSRLGNILRAAEAYPQSRYHVDAVALWPRMVWAMDKEYMMNVDTANDQCSFLLNSSFLSGVFTLMSWAASIYVWLFPSKAFSSIAYLLTGVITLIIAWFFYTASLLNVNKYGNLIRSSYDLFRFNLLEKLHLKLPVNIEEEKLVWEKITEFVTIGEIYGKKFFDYPDHRVEESEDITNAKSELEALGLADDI